MYQKAILLGWVGKEPETKSFDWGKVTNITLATSETFRRKDGEKVTNTEWHNIIFKLHLAEIAEKYVKKGDLIQIEGKIKTRSYEGKDGKKIYITEIHADNLVMIPYQKNETNKEGETYTEGDGLPF